MRKRIVLSSTRAARRPKEASTYQIARKRKPLPLVPSTPSINSPIQPSLAIRYKVHNPQRRNPKPPEAINDSLPGLPAEEQQIRDQPPAQHFRC